MRIMGLDLAIGTTGVCFPDGSTMRIRPKSKGDLRLGEIRDHIRLGARTAWADVVVIEDIQGRSLKGDAALVLPMLHGVVRTVLNDDGIPYVLVNQKTLKLYATGSGAADKAKMIAAAKERGHVTFTDDNECDAWWLHAAGMERAEQLLFVLPLPQRRALGTVDWLPLDTARRALGYGEPGAQGLIDPFADSVPAEADGHAAGCPGCHGNSTLHAVT